MGPNINGFIIIFLSLAAVFLSKLQQRTAMKIIQCWSYSLFAYFSFIYDILNSLYLRWYSKFLSYINAISLYVSNLYVSSIYNNTGSVLILQLILGNWSFTFSTNDLQMSVRVFVLAATVETYIHYVFEC